MATKEKSRSPRERRLGELGQLVGLQNAMAGPQLDQQALAQRQQTQQMGSVIQLMGLMQEMERSKQQNALAERQLSLQEKTAGAANDPTASIINVLGGLAGSDPAAAGALGDYIPQLGERQRAEAAAKTTQQRNAILPGVQQLYREGGSALPKRLAEMEGTVTPEVWAGLPWDQLNQSMKPPAPGMFSGLFGGTGQPMPQLPMREVFGPPMPTTPGATPPVTVPDQQGNQVPYESGTNKEGALMQLMRKLLNIPSK